MDFNTLQTVQELGVKLHKEFGPAVRLAGGCVRNPVTDRPIKDIDLFTDEEQLVRQICRFLGLMVERDPLACMANGQLYEGSRMPEEMKVWKCDSLGALHGGPEIAHCDVDIIWVPSITARIEMFPDYLSRMWIEGNGQCRASPEATEDCNKHQIRYWGSRMREKRLARFQELYGYEFTTISKIGSGKKVEPAWTFIDLEKQPVQIVSSKQAKRREGRPDYAPFWWDLPPVEQRADAAWDAMHDLCKGQAGASVW